MIDLYTWGTPNGRKISIMLEEVGLPYRVHPIDITKDEQFAPDLVAISPNSKIPAIIDSEGPDGNAISLFESGAILVYLAEKAGRFLPVQSRARYEVLQWLMFQMGGIGPMCGQLHHFRRFAPDYAIERYSKEVKRLYGTLDRHLSEHAYLADDYSIADMATYPWISRYEWQGMDLADYPAVKRWFDEISARPAVMRGMNVPA
ncbi:glutathione S-transferase N-terminal domain-containing protein [Sulfurirhabdus autotrophica]|uniref:GST-like protein n=1 Tax=Sulfurirhabdus autotrophica TaxID=1706046 RepID=A0A4R3Y2Q6_9PROT|nr:glutathione S-transferase N-terminal domain-containing protein [Sulfurirhabdus autotrophica]TCV84343.1 GST-like protein [Sulfurirhabdus autotrophica]